MDRPLIVLLILVLLPVVLAGVMMAVSALTRMLKTIVELVVRKPGQAGTFALYAALGPITGPLAWGAVRNIRKGRPVLAACWAVAIPLVWFDLWTLAGNLVHH
jgi:hypothetical protein